MITDDVCVWVNVYYAALKGNKVLTEQAECSMFVRETGQMTHSRVFY